MVDVAEQIAISFSGCARINPWAENLLVAVIGWGNAVSLTSKIAYRSRIIAVLLPANSHVISVLAGFHDVKEVKFFN